MVQNRWMYLQAKEDCLEKGLPIPEIDTVREDCLGEGVPAPDIEKVKDFLCFYIATSKRKIDQRFTVDSVNTHAEWFFAGFSRVTGAPTDKDDRSVSYGQAKVLKLTISLRQWVRRALTKEGLIVKKNRPKHLFS